MGLGSARSVRIHPPVGRRRPARASADRMRVARTDTGRRDVTCGVPGALTSWSRWMDPKPRGIEMEKLEKSDAEWQAELTPEQYEVLRRKGTERAFTGAY